MLKMVDGTGIIGVDMVCPLGGTISPPQPPNYDNIEMEGVGSLMLPNSLKAPLERLELIGNSMQGENPAPDNPQEIKNSGKWNEEKQKYEIGVKVTGKNLFDQSKLISGFINMTTGAFEESTNTSFANSLILDKPILLKSGQTLVTSVAGRDAQYFLRYRTYRKDGTFLINNEPVSFSYKATEDLYVIALFYNGMSEEDKKSLQIEISDEQTEYEPYAEQTLTLTSDRPITKWDKLVEQGGEYGIMYNSEHMLLNGSEDWVKTSIDNLFYLKSFEGLPNSYEIFCDKLKNFRGAVNAIELNCILANRTSLYICIDGITDVKTLRTWLSENNLEVYYNSKGLEFVPLPQETQLALQSLHSYNGTTHITVDSGEIPCGIKLTYRKEK